MPLKIKLPAAKWPIVFVLIVLMTAALVYYKACRNEDFEPRLHSMLLERGRKVDKFAKYEVSDISGDAFATEPDTVPRTQPIDKKPRTPEAKFHPALKDSLDILPPTQIMRVMISFSEEVQISPLPELDTNQPDDAEANQKIVNQARAILQKIEERSKSQQDSLIARLENSHNARILERFPLINCVLAEMPAGDIRRLSENRDVVFIAPQYSGEVPSFQMQPDDNDSNDVDDAGRLIGMDSNLNILGSEATETIGLLDTGVRATHDLLTDRIKSRRNCTGSSPFQCQNDGDIGDVWTEDSKLGHGTSSAAIISGNASLGTAYQGLTPFKINSYRVYTRFGLDYTAVVKAFDEAALFNRVILAEIQASTNGDEFDAISRAANQAFDIGAVVIAANGNSDDGIRITKAPAIARKVIGVGAVDIETKNTLSLQCHGTFDEFQYTKPDIQAPSYTETAGGQSDHHLRVFTGTSGAAPYIAAAAAMIRNRLKTPPINLQSPEPGLVYAFLILAGTETPSSEFDPKKGAGLIKLQNYGRFHWGNSGGPQSFLVKQGDKIDIKIKISGALPNHLSAALWWPEEPSDWDANIFLHLVGPDGQVKARSEARRSVFQRAQITTPLNSGDEWVIRIRGDYVPTGSSRKVYCAIHYYDH